MGAYNHLKRQNTWIFWQIIHISLQGLLTAWHNMSFIMSYTQIYTNKTKKLLSRHTTMRLCFPTHPATGVIPRSPNGIDLANQFTARKAIEVEARIQPLNQKKLVSRFIVFHSLNEMIINSSSFVLSFVILNMYPPWNWQLVHEHRPSQKEIASSNHPIFLGRKCEFQGPGYPPKDPGETARI